MEEKIGTRTERFLKRVPLLPIFFIIYIIYAIFINSLQSLPTINDFRGLSRICLLMEDGLHYCVNNNWGFAHPLVNYLLTKITGNLLYSQRIIAFLFTVFTIFLVDRVLLHVLDTKSVWARLAIFFLFLLTPLIIVSTTSVHLDIVPIVFVLFGIILANNRNLWVLMFAGFVVAISYWFRFHFIGYALLYPIFIVLLDQRIQKVKRFCYCVIGVVFGILVPYIMSYISYGVISIGNTKFVLAQLTGNWNWGPDYANRLKEMSLLTILGQINYLEITLKFLHALGALESYFIIVLAFILTSYVFSQRERRADRFVSRLRTWRKSVDWPAVIVILYALVSIMPFAFLRTGAGFPIRTQLPIIIVILPAIGYILVQRNQLVYWVVVFAIVFFGTIDSIDHLKDAFEKNQLKQSVIDEVVRVIPRETLEDYPDRVLCSTAIEFYNPYNKYLLTNPGVSRGWPLRFAPMVKKFGIIRMNQVFRNDNYKNYDYIIYGKLPTEKIRSLRKRLEKRGDNVEIVHKSREVNVIFIDQREKSEHYEH